MYPHRIHLRGPWECEPLAHTILHADGQIEAGFNYPIPAPRRININCRWSPGGLGDFAGRVRYRRRFHWPGRLDYYERLWLTFEGSDYFTTVWLNGEKLGQHEGAFDPFEFEITSLVQPRNELVVEVDLPAVHADARQRQRMLRAGLPEESGGLWGDVGVEVRREAFLRNVRLWATFAGTSPVLHVAGEVVGESERPLELYVLIGGSTLIYQMVKAASKGEPFHTASEVPSTERWCPASLGTPRVCDVRIELVDGATKLDSQSRPFGFRQIGERSREGNLAVNDKNCRVHSWQLCSPVANDHQWDAHNKLGVPIWLNIPLQGGFAADDEMRTEAVRQVRAIVTHLQHHPCIVGWTCHIDPQPHDAALDEAIYQAVTELDPTRPCFRSQESGIRSQEGLTRDS